MARNSIDLDSLPPALRKEMEKACDVYRGFHWNKEAEEALLIKDVEQIPETVVVLGELTGITYRTVKGPGSDPVLYVHAFDEPLPFLCCDPGKKQLYILAGGYTIEDRGIVH
jgi:hypothetical protein